MQTFFKALALSAIAAQVQAADPIADFLPRLSADRSQMTVSGQSAGGQFSCHLILTLSETFKGAGCSKGSSFGVWFGQLQDETNTPISIRDESLSLLYPLNDAGLIDSLDNFTTGERAVIIISGQDDPTVPERNQLGAFELFKALGMNGQDGDPAQNLKFSSKPDGHEFEREYAEEMLSFLWEKLGYGVIQPSINAWQNGSYTLFDQREFLPLDTDWTGSEFLDRENGHIYIPNGCKGDASAQCRVHLALHGCSNITYQMAIQAGYNEIAAANNIIMIYPDTRCWDNEGLVDPDNYMTKNGLVSGALLKMINRVTSELEPPTVECSQYSSAIDEAIQSLVTVKDYLANVRSDWVKFDRTKLAGVDAVAEQCGIKEQLDAMRQEQVRVMESREMKLPQFEANFVTQ